MEEPIRICNRGVVRSNSLRGRGGVERLRGLSCVSNNFNKDKGCNQSMDRQKKFGNHLKVYSMFPP